MAAAAAGAKPAGGRGILSTMKAEASFTPDFGRRTNTGLRCGTFALSIDRTTRGGGAMSVTGTYLGEIRMFSFSFAPKGYATADGQFLPINQNQALFSLFGTQYGGNGQTTFALPNLKGRTPIHQGNGHLIGEAAGEENHTLGLSEMPLHVHFVQASSANADNINPTGNEFASFNTGYAPPNNLVAIVPATVTNAGGSQPHVNQQPFQVINFGVALVGVFPSRN
jgi:microcystin-dependent protein